MNQHVPLTASAVTLVTALASADFHGAVEVGYWVSASDFGGASITAYVVDLYLESDDPWDGTSGSGDMLLNIYDWRLTDAARRPFFQSFTGTGWFPTNLGGPFDTEALRTADSFLTIGGFDADVVQRPGAGSGTGLYCVSSGDPFPSDDANWYNSSPPNYNGGAMRYDSGVLGTLIGRFSSVDGAFSLEGTELSATWNRGLGTSGQQAAFIVTPTPSAVALLGLAGLAGRRRRG